MTTTYMTGGPNSREVSASEFYDGMLWLAQERVWALPWWSAEHWRWKRHARDYATWAEAFRKLGQ